MSFLSFLKQVDQRVTYLVVVLLLVGVPTLLSRGYLRTPPFLFRLKDAVGQDKRIRQVIGTARGYSLRYSTVELQPGDTAHFSVQVVGHCDSTYVLVKGVYYHHDRGLAYHIQDTLFVHNYQ